jgi:pyridoxamine 5'-phosphate oxidase
MDSPPSHPLSEHVDPSGLRRQYDGAPFDTGDLAPTWLEQFQRWLDDAVAATAPEPNAMTVATADADGAPSARTVLLRGVDERGFCFYTNFDSRKGRELAANGHVAIALHWPEVLRQVRAAGVVERVADDESDAYWFARPRSSRISAWASAQSDEIADREELEARVADLEVRFADGDVPRPHNWGGFRVVPAEIEFWQHRDDRLHDRFVYARDEGGWRVTRLQP